MLRLVAYLLNKGIVTKSKIPETLEEGLMGFPRVQDDTPCATDCRACADICPTDAITLNGSITVDRGACIACGECIAVCPENKLVTDLSVNTFALNREDLLKQPDTAKQRIDEEGIYGSSLAIRVVSTGCSACDLEVAAAGNPLFDMERFGVSVVASPRFADAILVTGPVPKAMHEPLKACYESMAEPKIVIACGTCAVSGGIHKGGYAEANGADAIVPVDIFIPGCPPHPWQIIAAIAAAKKIKKARH